MKSFLRLHLAQKTLQEPFFLSFLTTLRGGLAKTLFKFF